MLGVCKLSWIPMRKEPNSSSEMVSCLLFGESYSVVSSLTKGWIAIQSHHDNYHGFISSDQFSELKIEKIPFAVVCKPVVLNLSPFLPPLLPMGAFLSKDEASFLSPSDYITLPLSQIASIDLIQTAESFLGTNYLWGGRSYAGIDCSGFMQIIFRMQGLQLPRDSGPQFDATKLSVEEVPQRGDLLFFSKEKNGSISHVGLYCGDNVVIHAAGFVRKDTFLWKEGIFRNETKTHFYVGLGRVFN